MPPDVLGAAKTGAALEGETETASPAARSADV